MDQSQPNRCQSQTSPHLQWSPTGRASDVVLSALVDGFADRLARTSVSLYNGAMPNGRLALALEQMKSGDWLIFEQFAAEFLAVEYPSLRTTAAPRGDKGRDGELYKVDEEPNTVLQYSVSRDWDAKIRSTVNRLAETMPDVRQIIYVTNQDIGVDSDDLKHSLRLNRKISLDIRDCSWFVARELTYTQREVAANELIERFVTPLLAERGVKDRIAPVLKAEDARVALLHLALDQEDTASEKSLTRRSFEALTLSALHDTSPENLASRDQLIERVRRLLPAGFADQIEQLTDSALTRLSKKNGPVKHHKKSGGYCLAFEERKQVQARIAVFMLEENALVKELIEVAGFVVPEASIPDDQRTNIGNYLRYCLDSVLLKRGESFAATVATGESHRVSAEEVVEAISESDYSWTGSLTVRQAATVVLEVLDRPSEVMGFHLRRLADAYTLYAFLRQTPDVQRTLVNVFAHGDIWLDTTIILPLFVETLLSNPAQRHYTTTLQAAVDAGLHLYVTNGVLEEVEGHLRRCIAFARSTTSEWRSRIPFVYTAYALSGRARSGFALWAENFMGAQMPREDIADYLDEMHAIRCRDLIDESDAADISLRAAVQEIWFTAHEQRRSSSKFEQETDPTTRRLLVAHDVENTVGVMQLRKQAASSPMGYRQWWLTLDRVALSLGAQLRERLGPSAPSSPAISPDFMSQYLRLGPLRTAIESGRWAKLPLLMDISRYEYMPKELIDRAEALRADSANVDERILRRRIRDSLNLAKLTHGPEALAGIAGAEDRVKAYLKSQATGDSGLNSR